MSNVLFSLWNSRTRKALVRNVTAEELAERQRSYTAHGGNALLVVSRGDEEPKFPRPRNIPAEGEEKVGVPITKSPPRATPTEATQLSMLEVPERVEIISSKILLEHGQRMCNFLIERAPEVGMNFSWSGVVKRVLGGKIPSTELTKTNDERDSEYTFLKRSVRAVIEQAQDQKGAEAIVIEGRKALAK